MLEYSLKMTSDKVKILIIIHNQSNTGPYFKILELCEALININLEVVLLCTSRTKRLQIKHHIINSIEIIESPDLLMGKFRQGIDIWNTFNRIFTLRKLKFDLIHAIDCRPVVIIPALIIKNKLKIPLIISWWDLFSSGGTSLERSGVIYSYTLGKIEEIFETSFRKYATVSTVISSNLFNRLENLGVDKEYIFLLRTGSNIKQIEQKELAKLRLKLNLSINKIIFCYVGTIFERDLKLLLTSLGLLSQSELDKVFTILIGNHHLPKDICDKLNIFQTGYLKTTSEIFEFLLASDFGLLPLANTPANQARWPSKITDYWSSGLPVLATPVNDFKNIFSDKEIGLLSENDHPESYSALLKQAILLSKAEKKHMSEKARKFAEMEFDWKVIAKKQKEIYKLAITKNNCKNLLPSKNY